MNEDLFRSLLAYKTTMAQAKELMRRGILTQREYARFEKVFAQKYGLTKKSIFREKVLAIASRTDTEKNNIRSGNSGKALINTCRFITKNVRIITTHIKRR